MTLETFFKNFVALNSFVKKGGDETTMWKWRQEIDTLLLPFGCSTKVDEEEGIFSIISSTSEEENGIV